MWTRIGTLAVVASIAAITFGCSQQPPQKAATTEEKDFTLTPASVKVQAGIVTGELTQLKVTEEVETNSGKVVTPPQLSGTLNLKNTSKDQVVRLIGGKLRYLDAHAQPLKFGEDKTETNISVSSYDSTQLNPGQDTTQSITADFPAEALKANSLKDLSLELTYEPLPYMDQTLNFQVAVGGK